MVREVVHHQDAVHLAPDLLASLHPEERRAARGEAWNDTPSGPMAAHAPACSPVVEPRDGEVDRAEPPPVVDQGEPHPVRMVRHVLRLNVRRDAGSHGVGHHAGAASAGERHRRRPGGAHRDEPARRHEGDEALEGRA
jgi:hypothetical protein